MKRMTENIMRMKIKNIIQLQLVVIIYTISSVMSKIAAGYRQDIVRFVIFFALEFLILGLYAILWQQLIKKFDLSVAYANRSMALLWSILWAFIFFRDTITVKNIIGVIFVVIGTFIINLDDSSRIDATEDGEAK